MPSDTGIKLRPRESAGSMARLEGVFTQPFAVRIILAVPVGFVVGCDLDGHGAPGGERKIGGAVPQKGVLDAERRCSQVKELRGRWP